MVERHDLPGITSVITKLNTTKTHVPGCSQSFASETIIQFNSMRWLFMMHKIDMGITVMEFTIH